MHASLKFLALLALPFAGFTANASPTPTTRLEISIAITENDGESAPGSGQMITRDFPLNLPIF